MKKVSLVAKLSPVIVKLLLLSLTFISTAKADSSSLNPLIGLRLSAELSRYLVTHGIVVQNNIVVRAANATPAGTAIPIYKLDTSNNLHLNVLSGKVLTVDIAGTPSYTLDGLNQSFPLPAVITPSTTFPTPNAGDTIAGRYNLIASTAPTATYVELPAATASAGKSFSVYNQAALNPVAIVPKSGDTINALVAATPFSCTTGKFCTCTVLTSSLYACQGL